MIGYVCYVDRFCGTLPALADRLDYLDELGITYLHLMPLLRPRDRARTTAATRSWTTARSTRGWARWPTWRSSPERCASGA